MHKGKEEEEEEEEKEKEEEEETLLLLVHLISAFMNIVLHFPISSPPGDKFASLHRLQKMAALLLMVW